MGELARRALTMLRGTPEARLLHAYHHFWRLGPAASLKAYDVAITEMRRAEYPLPSDCVHNVLKQAAHAWHQATGHCPFCGGPDLHSPAEAILEGAA